MLLFMTLLLDGGVAPSQPARAGADGGTVPSRPSAPVPDGGTPRSATILAEGIEWPAEFRPLATLDGPAVIAAHAALQRLLASLPKEYAGDCSYSAKAMEVSVGLERGLYFVEIQRRVDRCGWATPGFQPSPHWYELYAVSPDGKVLARYPYRP
ncbi:hypothetical protein LXT23_37085 [Pyxidicoccus sp. QH1ED-7-1]|nr:hypothetical protein [Pyxidicoccus xibeiensis]